jgi:CHAD domain-containing protein
MAFELKVNEPVGAGITRNVKNQIERALKYLDTKGEPAAKHSSAAGASQKDAIAEVRKCFKKVRAAVRLAREELGDDLYHEENWCFRDAARPITQVRDARVLVETVEGLRQPLVHAIGPGAYTKIRAALIANRQEVARLVLEEGKAFAAVTDAATRAVARLSDWKLQRDGWAAIESGLRRTYRQGRRALALAAESPSVASLHEWRKQTKYLWHQLQLLQATWTESEKELVNRTHQLATLLGEDHDLAVLRETLAADPLPYGGHRILKGVFAVIDPRRGELERQAFAIGREIYKEPPTTFTSRIEALMHCQEAA